MRTLTLFLLAAAAVAAAPRTTSLAGMWDFRYDAANKGEASNWQRDDSPNNWTTIRVPGSYNQSLHGNVLYQGKAWYRTTFASDLAAGERALLHFGGVVQRAKVWVNGQPAGEHRFPYTGFTLDVTALVKPGANRLTVLADNQLLERAIPDTHADGWWNYGGINRDVRIEFRPGVATGDVVVVTRRSGTGWDLNLTLRTTNSGAPAEGTLAVVLEDGGGRSIKRATQTVHLPAGATETKFHWIPDAVEPWTPEHPALYTLRVATSAGGLTHEKSLRIGFRQIEVQGTRILLNGRPVFIKGANYHEMYPGSGMTLSRDQVRRDLLDMKAMGANFVRLAHYSHAQQVYELCDELGLMVWSEIPAWQTRAETLGDAEVFEQWAAPQLREMIEQYREHSSIVVWSVGNEFPSEREAVAGYVRRATAFVKELDPTRLVTFASDRRERDISFAPVDFIGINEYYGWYYGKIHDLAAVLDVLHQKWPTKPIVVTEFGADSIAGLRNPAPPDSGMDYSEDKQMKLVGTHLSYIYDPARASFMAGALVWVYADFPNPAADSTKRPQHPPAIFYTNCKGLVTGDRQHKLIWELVKGYFTRP